MKQKDAELIQQVLQGKQEAFGILVKRYQKGVHALVWRKIGDFHIAEEITQDAFLKAYHKLDTLKNRNLFAGWLYVIASHLCSDWYRKNPQPLESLETIDASKMEQMSYSRYITAKQATEADKARREIVKKLLQKLPESERTVITLYYFGEMTSETIGKFLGISANTVRSRLSRARNRLKKEEDMIRQSLDSFQLSAYLTENIMREISRVNPATPIVKKPVLPWVISAASAVLIFLLIGVGAQHLSRFQKPYSLNAPAEPTVKIIEALIVLDAPAKPAIRNQTGNSVTPSKNLGAGHKPDAPLFAAVAADETELLTPSPQWVQTKGPEGGRVVSLFTTTPGDIYAGTAAGLYKLTDGKQVWQLTTREAPEAFTVYNEIGWWPLTERQDTLYFATDTEVLASIDRGETWNALGMHPKGLPTGIAITDGIHESESDILIYLALANGIYRSEDAGKSWLPLRDGLVGRKIRGLAAVENTVFVGTDDGLYRLKAGTWERLSLTQTVGRGQKLPIHALAVAGSRLYAAIGKQFRSEVGTQVKTIMTGSTWWALYRSTDLGNTWYAVDPRKKLEDKSALQNGSVVESSTVVINFKNPHLASETDLAPSVKIFASEATIIVTDGQHQYYSMNTGETWTSLDLHDILDDRQHVVPSVVMLDANTFYIGSETGIHRTTDAGQSWHQFNAGLASRDVTDLVAANGKLYAKITDGIVTSTDGGDSWTPLPIGGIDNITDLAAFDGSVYARGEKNMVTRFFRLSVDDDRFIAILRTPNFEKVKPAEQEWLNKIQDPFRDALTEEAKQNREIDEPIDLEDYDPDKLSAALNKRFQDLDAILSLSRLGDFVVSDETYYVERGQKLFRWKPGVTAWHDTGLPIEEERTTPVQSNKVPYVPGFQVPLGLKFAVSDRTIYVGTGNGALFQSFDEGDTWNNVTANLPFPISGFNIAFAGSTVYIATDKGVIYSRDGIDWHKATDVDGAMLVIDKFAVDGTTVYGVLDIHAHPERYVCQLKENSNTWKQVTPEISNRVTSLAVDGNTLYVGTIGRGVLRFTLEE